MARGHVKDKDHGYKKLVERVAKQGRVSVTVGIHEAEGSKPHEDEEGKASALTVEDVAVFHEFGLGVPQRSFLRAWADENEAANKVRLQKIAQAVLRGAIPSADVGLDRFGLYAVGSIQRRIKARIDPPLAKSTIKKKTVQGKKGDVPLINTGQLWTSITHRVVKGSGEGEGG